MAQQYETLAEAAERTGISQRTLRRRIAAGYPPSYLAAGSSECDRRMLMSCLGHCSHTAAPRR